MVDEALILVALAAVLHATWNVMLKTSGDPLQVSARGLIAAVVLGSPPAAAAWLLTGRPGLPPEAWLLAVVSAVLEVAYFTFLSEAYRRGELSVVYPIARGTAPLLAVAIGLVLLGERLSAGQLLGTGCLLLGIWLARRPTSSGAALVPALLTGVSIATYTSVDSAGVKMAPPWLYAWALSVILVLLLAAWVWSDTGRRVRRAAGYGAAVEGSMEWGRSAAIGVMMTITYLLVLFALRLAPLAVVVPARESAIVLVTGWGIWRLREAGGMWLRLAGGLIILAGIALLAAP